MHETIKEQERRERLVNQTYSEDFMGYMHARNHIFSSKPFRVNIEPDQSLKSPSMDGTELPELLKREMKDQAVLLDASFKNFGTSEALAFTSADNSGTFPMHQDGNYITLHKTLIGRHGMSYMPQPITNEQKALARNRLKFSAMFKDDPSLTDTIPTGTLSIFGTEFYHASSGVESVSVGSVLSMDCIPVSLTHDL